MKWEHTRQSSVNSQNKAAPLGKSHQGQSVHTADRSHQADASSVQQRLL